MVILIANGVKLQARRTQAIQAPLLIAEKRATKIMCQVKHLKVPRRAIAELYEVAHAGLSNKSWREQHV